MTELEGSHLHRLLQRKKKRPISVSPGKGGRGDLRRREKGRRQGPKGLALEGPSPTAEEAFLTL